MLLVSPQSSSLSSLVTVAEGQSPSHNRRDEFALVVTCALEGRGMDGDRRIPGDLQDAALFAAA